jgi:hypothetical protein
MAYFLFDQWFPFWLTGKQFLKFFLMYMAVGYGIIFTDKLMHYNPKTNVINAIIGLTIILSLSRVTQGLYHHKPVSYLVLLTIAHVIILGINSKKDKVGYKNNGSL